MSVLRGSRALLCMALALCIAGCSENKNKNYGIGRIEPDFCLSLPLVPDTVPKDAKLTFVIMHYWDALDSVSPALRADTAFMEQSFVNFLPLFEYVPDSVRDSAVDRLLSIIRPDRSAYTLIAEIAGKYLDDPNSPMRSEDIFIIFLRKFASDQALPPHIRQRAQYRLARAMKNRPGMKAADLRLVTRYGERSTLRRLVAPDTTVVMFYDHDCQHCHQIIERMTDESSLIPYRVLAIDVTEDRRGWDSTKTAMPREWQIAFATEQGVDEIYALPALPSFYLIDPEGVVILKDFSL